MNKEKILYKFVKDGDVSSDDDYNPYGVIDHCIIEMLKENTNLKQALIDIRELVKNNSIEIDGVHTEVCCSGDNILQIIDKVLGGSDEK